MMIELTDIGGRLTVMSINGKRVKWLDWLNDEKDRLVRAGRTAEIRPNEKNKNKWSLWVNEPDRDELGRYILESKNV